MTPPGYAVPRRPLDARLRTALAAVALFGAVLTLGALALLGPKTAPSVAVGAAIAAANLWALARIVAALLPDDVPDGNGGEGQESRAPVSSAGSKGAWAVVALMKMFALLAAVWLLMRYAVVSPLPMLLGFAALPIGIAIGSLVSDRSAPPHS